MQKIFDPARIFTDLKSEVSLPDQRIGRFEIRHKIIPAGQITEVVTMRNALFMHYKPLKIIMPFDYEIAELIEHEDETVPDSHSGKWMSTTPQEIFTSHMVHDVAFDDVLIGGLGLGYSTQKIAGKHGVNYVTVVELEEDVIKLVKPYLRRNNVEVIHDDLYKFLETTNRKFDFCYFDIWASTGERELPKVTRLHELSKRVLRKGGKVMCWMEDEMHGQTKHAEEMRQLLIKSGMIKVSEKLAKELESKRKTKIVDDK